MLASGVIHSPGGCAAGARRCTAQSTSHVTAPLGRFLAVPASLLGAVLVYAQVTGLPLPQYALVYAAYLFAPAAVLLLGRARRSRWVPLWGLVAASLFWLPIEFALLPALPVPPPDGYDVSLGVSIIAAFYLFLVAWPLAGIGLHPGARRTGLQSGWRGVGGIRSRGAAARVAHGFFNLAAGGRCCGAPGDAGAHLYAHGRARGVSLPRGDSESPDTLVGTAYRARGRQPVFLDWRTSPIFAMCSSPRWPGSGMGGCMPGPARLPRRP